MSGMINDNVEPHPLKPNKGCHDDDIQPLKLIFSRFSDSVTHFHNTEASESTFSDQTKDEDISPVCRTPSESKFDPFAPGPDALMFAPKKPKSSGLLFRQPLRCNLSIDSEVSVEADDLTEDPNAEECFSELIFTSLLELIISTKLMEISDKNQEAESDQTEECKTPTSLPLLTGFAETCPLAPRRPTLFLKRFDQSICRKLDF